jgi:hypothetical protein
MDGGWMVDAWEDTSSHPPCMPRAESRDNKQPWGCPKHARRMADLANPNCAQALFRRFRAGQLPNVPWFRVINSPMLL